MQPDEDLYADIAEALSANMQLAATLKHVMSERSNGSKDLRRSLLAVREQCFSLMQLADTLIAEETADVVR